MPSNYLTVSVGGKVYPCDFNLETLQLKVELSDPAQLNNPMITINEDSVEPLQKQIWDAAMSQLSSEGVFEDLSKSQDEPTFIPSVGASPMSDAEIEREIGVVPAFQGPAPKGVAPPTRGYVERLEQQNTDLRNQLATDNHRTSSETLIGVQRVIMNQMNNLFGVVAKDDEPMLSVMQSLWADGESYWSEWKGLDMTKVEKQEAL